MTGTRKRLLALGSSLLLMILGMRAEGSAFPLTGREASSLVRRLLHREGAGEGERLPPPTPKQVDIGEEPLLPAAPLEAEIKEGSLCGRLRLSVNRTRSVQLRLTAKEPKVRAQRDTWRPALLVLSIALAVSGQVAFTRAQRNLGVVLYGLGLLLSVYALAGTGYAAATMSRESHTGQRRKIASASLIVLAVACELIVLWLDRQRSLSDADAYPLYFLCMALFAAAFLVLDGNPLRRLSSDWWEVAALVIMLIAAFGIRTYRLDTMPPGFWGDEGNDGLEAVQVLSGEFPTPFRTDWGGNPAMKAFYNALAVKLLGRNKIAIRSVAAVFGTLGILFTYLLSRQLFSTRVALLAGFLLTFSRWHIHRSRFDSVVIAGAFFPLMSYYFLFRGLRSRRLSDFGWAGLALGFGLNSYHGARIAPIVIVMVVAHQALFGKLDFVRRYYRAFATLILGAAVVFAPLVLFYTQHENAFAGRARYVWLFNNRGAFRAQYPGDHSDLEMLALQAKDTLLMFNYRGDSNPVNNWGRRPMLDFVTSVLFVLGMGYSLFRWKDSRHFFLLSWLSLTLTTGSVLTIGAPQSARTAGVIPALCMEAAIFLDVAWDTLRRAWPKLLSGVLAGIVLAVLAVSGYLNLDIHFNKYMQDRGTWHVFSGAAAQMGAYLRSLGPGVRVHFLATQSFNRYHRGLQFLSGGFVGQDFWDTTAAVPVREQAEMGIVYILRDTALVPLLRYFYPNGTARRFRDPFGSPTFAAYEVSADEVTNHQGLMGRYYAGDAWEGEIVLARRDGPIAFDWDRDSPLSGPFSVTWEGTLYASQPGRHDFFLDAAGTVGLSIDGTPVIPAQEAAGLVSAAVDLARGLHAVTVRYARSGEAGGRISWSWAAPGIPGGLVPRHLLHTASANHGLLGRYYSNPEWSGQPSVRQVDPYLYFRWERDIDPLKGPFSVEWDGYLEVDRPGIYGFSTRSSNGSWLYINDELVVDNGGQHHMQYRNGVMDMEPGQHRIEVRYVYTEGWRVMEAYWTPPGGSEEVLPVDRLLPNSQGLIQMMVSEPATAPTRALLPPPPENLPVSDTWSYVTGWGAQGKGPGQFNNPQDVVVSPDGGVYVVDTGNYRVQQFDSAGRFLGAWGTHGRDKGQFVEPWAMDIDREGYIYVLDASTGRIQKFGPGGEFLSTVGEKSGFYSPRGLAVDMNGSLYVADTGGNRVVKLSPEGELLVEFGKGLPVATGGLSQPDDVVIDDAGNVLVSDKLNLRFQKFDALGRPVDGWQLAWAKPERGPRIALGPERQILLLDQQGAQVWVYDQDGQPLARWGQPDDGPGHLEYPTGIAVDRQGYVYIVDAGAHRVHKFRLP